jgi:hypothetical protein
VKDPLAAIEEAAEEGRFKGVTIYPSGGARGRFQISVRTPQGAFNVSWCDDLRAGLAAAFCPPGQDEDVFG